ncbi:MAG: HD domain-containing protein [Desulfovibrio sp.]|nr:HD domain-containing protein [Desulfovibrio sp.]
MKLNLQNKLLFSILSALLLFMGTSAFILSHFITDRIENNIISMLHAENRILAKNLHNTVLGYTSTIRAMASIPNLITFAEFESSKTASAGITKDEVFHQVQDLLRKLSKNYPFFSQFNFASADGQVVASSNEKSIGNVNISDRDYFKETMQGKECISPPLVSKSIGEKSVIVAAPVLNSSYKICGIVYGILPCRSIISDTIKNIKMLETGYAYIVDGSSGLMLAHDVYDKVQTMDMFHFQPWMRTLAAGDTGLKTDYRDSQGNRRLVVYYKEAISGWIAVSCIAMEEIEAQEAFARNLILALTIGSAALVALILIIITRSVTRDILTTNQFAQAVASGELGRTLDMHRDDEIGALGDAIRRMVDSLRRMMRISAEQAQERELNLTIMRDSLMLTLADLIESRDLSTGQHIRKTAGYVRIIIEQLQREGLFLDILTEDYVESVIRSAPLHDIGKINVPDAILNKPGKLTDEEFAIMKTHTSVGGRIIDHIISTMPDTAYLAAAKDLATYHHERWSGGGYPEGLSGEDIPLVARIMAVADVFDALVSTRAYKKGFSLEKAFAIIQEESGSHFDPRVVAAFFAAKDEIIRTKEEFDNDESGDAME